tara:strand:- start:18906 stop:19181 length:276 start_codon:yes stop_codon:yes gene_type:complete
MQKNKFYKKPKAEDFMIPGCPNGVRVPHGNIEAALRKFKKQVKEFGTVSEFTDKKAYIKKSAKKRIQKEEAIERLRREVVKQKILDKNSCF